MYDRSVGLLKQQVGRRKIARIWPKKEKRPCFIEWQSHESLSVYFLWSSLIPKEGRERERENAL